jgi:subtilisin family serine protease
MSDHSADRDAAAAVAGPVTADATAPRPRPHRGGPALSLLATLLVTGCGGGDDLAAANGAAAPMAAVSGRAMALAAAPAAAAAPEVVVLLQPGATIAEVAAPLPTIVVDQFGQRPIWRLRLSSGVAAGPVLAALRADPRVRFAELRDEGSIPMARDQVVWAVDQVVWAVGQGEAALATNWSVPALGLRQAHAVSVGQDVRVAVFDTAIDLAHPLIAPALARDAQGRLLGKDFVDGDDWPAEDGKPGERGYGHGTHVAGIVVQAAPGARVMPVRVLDRQGRGDVWVLAEALLWAVDPDGDPSTDDGAQVLNYSLSTRSPTHLLRAALALVTCDDDDDEDDGGVDLDAPGFEADKARCDLQGGAVVMAAAGNDGSKVPQYPAAEGLEGSLAVTAHRRDDRLTSWANRGPWVGLAAPGDRVVSAYPGGLYSTASGSSMATPWASGIAALLRQRHPDWKPVDVTKRLQDRGRPVCGRQDGLRALDAAGAVLDADPAPRC